MAYPSLGGFDRQFVEELYNSIAPSPYGGMVERDPYAQQQTTELMLRLANPQDVAHGTYPQAPPAEESDPLGRGLKVAGAVATLPLRVLGAGFDVLGEALGSPASYKRKQREELTASLDRMGILDQTFTDEQKIAMGYDPQDVLAMSQWRARQKVGAGQDNAHGVDTSSMPLPQPRSTSFLEWALGEGRQEEARRSARAMAYKAALERMAAQEDIKATQAMTRARTAQAEGAEWDVQQGYKYGDTKEQLGIDKDRSALQTDSLNRDYLRAQIGNIGADNARLTEADRRAAETQRFQARLDREKLRAEKLKNRGLALDLRERANGSGSPDLLKVISALNSANSPGEKIATGAMLGVPMTEIVTKANPIWSGWDEKEIGPDVAKMQAQATERTRLNREAQTASEDGLLTPTPTPTPITAPPQQRDVVNIRRMIAPIMIGRSESEIQNRAEALARIAPLLNRSSRQAFISSAVDHDLSDAEAEALLAGLR